MLILAREAMTRFVWGAPRVVMDIAPVACPDPRDTSVPRNIIAYPGDEVVCDGPAQHVVARVLFTITVGDNASDPDRLFEWVQPRPELGKPILDIKCAHCDGRWVSSGMHLHFKGGWR